MNRPHVDNVERVVSEHAPKAMRALREAIVALKRIEEHKRGGLAAKEATRALKDIEATLAGEGARVHRIGQQGEPPAYLRDVAS